MSRNRVAVFSDFQAADRGGSPRVLDSGAGPIITYAKSFTYQSYFSTSLQHLALLAQPPGKLINEATIGDVQIGGFALALHPASETPVMVQFRVTGNSGASAPMLLKPGQIIRPTGLLPGVKTAFAGFSWGLPYGWLGGGLAQLLLLQSPDADIYSPGNQEVPFHRFTARILPYTTATAADKLPSAANWPCNWPTKFPWFGAKSDTDVQGGAPILKVKPTRTILRLSKETIATVGGAPMRALMMGTDHLDANSSTNQDASLQTATGVIAVATPKGIIQDMVWGNSSPVGTDTGATTPTQHQYLEFKDGMLVGLGCERSASSGVVFISGAASTEIDDAASYVDVLRLGEIG